MGMASYKEHLKERKKYTDVLFVCDVCELTVEYEVLVLTP